MRSIIPSQPNQRLLLYLDVYSLFLLRGSVCLFDMNSCTSMEDGDRGIETTDFDTSILAPWLPRSHPLRNRGVWWRSPEVLPVAVRPLRT